MVCRLIGAKALSAEILLIRPLGTKFSEILIEIHTFSFKKMHLEMSYAKWRPYCLGLNVLITKSGISTLGGLWTILVTTQSWVACPHWSPSVFIGGNRAKPPSSVVCDNFRLPLSRDDSFEDYCTKKTKAYESVFSCKMCHAAVFFRCKFQRDRWFQIVVVWRRLLEASGRVGHILTTVTSPGYPQWY